MCVESDTSIEEAGDGFAIERKQFRNLFKKRTQGELRLAPIRYAT